MSELSELKLYGILLLMALPLVSCQTPVIVDSSESEKLIDQAIQVEHETKCRVLEPSMFGTMKDGIFVVSTDFGPDEFNALPEAVRTKIARDEVAYEEECGRD